MLGHKNYRTTQRYAHIADTALRDAVNLTSATIVRAGRAEVVAADDRRGLGVAVPGGLVAQLGEAAKLPARGVVPAIAEPAA